MKFNIKSRKGFTLIELLVVIGILAVLAAIAIPSVAGLIDRANVSADKTNANEYTNAIERFTSEYELYCQDIASGTIDFNNLDAAQGRVYNVTKARTRGDIEKLESVSGNLGSAINRDTKYPINNETLELIIQNYTKTSSATFEPKQSDCSYWYNPDCGIVVVANSEASKSQLNDLIISGRDAKGNELDPINANWVNMTVSSGVVENTGNSFLFGREYESEMNFDFSEPQKVLLRFNLDKTISLLTHFYTDDLEFDREEIYATLPIDILEYNEDFSQCQGDFAYGLTFVASNNGETVSMTTNGQTVVFSLVD